MFRLSPSGFGVGVVSLLKALHSSVKGSRTSARSEGQTKKRESEHVSLTNGSTAVLHLVPSTS